jgi:PIN domain nuclease of toxin-antitoxin system
MIVIDTHVWIWWLSSPKQLSKTARSAIDYSERIGISPISCWEIATKVSKGKIELDRDIRVWMQQALSLPRVELMPITPEIAIVAGYLGTQGFHGDPADRIITATSICNGARLVTKDKSIRAFESVITVW